MIELEKEITYHFHLRLVLDLDFLHSESLTICFM